MVTEDRSFGMTEQVLAGLDESLRRDLVEMTCDLVNISSPTGEEEAIGDYVAGRFSELRMDVQLQQVEPGRNNVVARLKGAGTGPSVLFNAHFDTSTTGKEPDLPFGHKPQAAVQGGWIYGLGVSNMKSAFSGYYGAIRMLQKAGVVLEGDLIVTGVVGEIEKAPIDRYQGAQYRGGGVGTMFAAHHGVVADAAIIGEPTGLRVQLGNSSYAFAKIQTTGVAQHTWSKEFGVDAIDKAVQIMTALRRWEPEFERSHPHPRMGSRIGIGAIEGGYPFKPSVCPAPSCTVYLDFRFPPNYSIADIRKEVADFLEELRLQDPELDTKLDFYLARNGYEIGPEERVADVVARAHREISGADPEPPGRYRYDVSADCSILNEYGIPSLTYGPGGMRRDGSYGMYDEHGELLSIENLYTATKVYALSALGLAGKSHVGIVPPGAQR